MPAAVRAEELNFGAALRWRGHVDTDLQFSSFATKDHTVAFRFMTRYSMAREATILSIDGAGDYRVGVAQYSSAGVRLEVIVGGNLAYYTFGAPADDDAKKPLENEWHTVAIACKAGTCKLFFDGKHRERDLGGDLSLNPAGLVLLNGTLRIGSDAGRLTQFYGFVDDVVVLGTALDKTGVANLFAKPRLHASVKAPNLIRAYTFDSSFPGGKALTGAFAHPATFRGAAFKTLLSLKRDDRIDAMMMPPAHASFAVQLPFVDGVSWMVSQGNEGLASHHGSAAFALDLVRANPPGEPGLPNEKTCGAVVTAPADGHIIDGCDIGDPPLDKHGDPILAKGCAPSLAEYTSDGGPLIDGYNKLHMKVGPRTFGYLHLLTGSLTKTFPNRKELFHSEFVTGPTFTIPVKAGQKVGEAGTRGKTSGGNSNCHLHFGAAEEGVGVPTLFEDYEYLPPGSTRWFSASGTPKKGQLIRRPPEAKTKALAKTIEDCAEAKKMLAEQEPARQKLSQAVYSAGNDDARVSAADAVMRATRELDRVQLRLDGCK
jgi:concanavalin A-like lectin/glucanase superfamily protein